MKYYIDGKQATAEEVRNQETENERILNISDPVEFLKELSKAKFIISENVIKELNK
jgi:hypothetical protein